MEIIQLGEYSEDNANFPRRSIKSLEHDVPKMQTEAEMSRRHDQKKKKEKNPSPIHSRPVLKERRKPQPTPPAALSLTTTASAERRLDHRTRSVDLNKFFPKPLHLFSVLNREEIEWIKPCSKLSVRTSSSSIPVKVHGTIAYVSQSAWIQSGSIRENILLGSNFGNNKYQDTLDRCSLLKYLKLLPYGELTEIGSGGQKQRIQLARALYKDADIYLLDDPFSALDAHTALSLFNEYVIEALSTMTDLLVTHQVDFLHAFDSILFGYTKQKKRDCCGFYKKSRVNKV
ncbi:uncharacterized protein LOC142530425 [Primulina tabacum]|uniref:uncharacterized protein LOC142530425 n=1 Tax=Primulina tabacum TaxID=48773 RepID=UPI003F5A1A91